MMNLHYHKDGGVWNGRAIYDTSTEKYLCVQWVEPEGEEVRVWWDEHRASNMAMSHVINALLTRREAEHKLDEIEYAMRQALYKEYLAAMEVVWVTTRYLKVLRADFFNAVSLTDEIAAS